MIGFLRGVVVLPCAAREICTPNNRMRRDVFDLQRRTNTRLARPPKKKEMLVVFARALG